MVCTVTVQGSEIHCTGYPVDAYNKNSAYSSFESKLFSIPSHSQISSKYLFSPEELSILFILIFKECIPLFSSFY